MSTRAAFVSMVLGATLVSVTASAIPQARACRGSGWSHHAIDGDVRMCSLMQDPWQNCAEDPWQLTSRAPDTFSDPWQDSEDPWQPFMALPASTVEPDPWQPLARRSTPALVLLGAPKDCEDDDDPWQPAPSLADPRQDDLDP